MKKEISRSKVAERNKLVKFVVESKKKAPTGGPSHTGFCRIIYFRHADREEEDYTYGFK